MTVARDLHRHIDARPEKTFCHFISAGGDHRAYEYGRLGDGIANYASALTQRGVKRGDVVLIFLPHSPDLWFSYFGAMWIGAIPSFMPLPSAKQDIVRYWSSHSKLFALIRPRAVISEPANLQDMAENGLLAETPVRLAPQDVEQSRARLAEPVGQDRDIALLQHTSGTTGLKKGVALSYGAIRLQTETYRRALGGSADDRVASWLPLYHDMGLIACTVVPLAMGQTLIAMDPFRWAAEPWILFEAIDRYSATHCWLPNFAFEHLRRAVDPTRRQFDLRSIRAYVNCSEPCKPETFDRFVNRFSDYGVRREQLQVCYAMAETVFAVSQTDIGGVAGEIRVDAKRLHEEGVVSLCDDPGQGRRVASVGRPLPGFDVEIRSESGVALEENRVGEIFVHGGSLFEGYFNLPDLTAERLHGGVYRTRDFGFLHGGELYVLGRQDDVIIVNGRNFMAHDIEFAIASVPGLKQGRAVAIGVYNDAVGSREMIIIAERDPAQDRDVQAIRRDIKAAVLQEANLMIREARVVEPGWLVKTTSGKISREGNIAKYLASLEERRSANAGRDF